MSHRVELPFLFESQYFPCQKEIRRNQQWNGMENINGVKNQDLTSDRLRAFLLWGVPRIGFFIGVFANPALRTILWSSSLFIAGTACLINAFRCGRLHCYFTGPFYLLMATLSLFYGLGFLDFGALGWVWIGGVVVIVAPILTRLPERLSGKYVTKNNGK